MKKAFEKARPWIAWALRVIAWALRRASRWVCRKVIRPYFVGLPVAIWRCQRHNIKYGAGDYNDPWPEEYDDAGADPLDDYDSDDAGQIAAVKAEIDYYGEKLDGAFYRMSTATTSTEREKAADAINRYRQRIAAAERKIDKLLAQEG